MSYFDRVRRAAAGAVSELERRGVDRRFLQLGGPGDPDVAPSIPTEARSEFLANRAMGDWAEQTLADAIRRTRNDWKVVHYGDADRIAAGAPGFRQFFLERIEEVRLHGKRPDLLVFPRDTRIDDDVTAVPLSELRDQVRHALGAIEVRSSKFEALRYMARRKADREAGARTGRESPSFTVKVEDLKVVYRWLENHDVPECYCQVFFDSVFAINILTILDIIAAGRGFTIENPAKNQAKATMMIPITSGRQVGTFTSLPRFEVGERVSQLGRHDAYVIPVGGTLELDVAALEAVMLGAPLRPDGSRPR